MRGPIFLVLPRARRPCWRYPGVTRVSRLLCSNLLCSAYLVAPSLHVLVKVGHLRQGRVNVLKAHGLHNVLANLHGLDRGLEIAPVEL